MKNTVSTIIINRFILYGLLFWPFFWGNAARNIDMMGSMQLIYVPKTMMLLLEVVIMVIFGFISIIRIRKNNLNVLLYMGIIILTAFLSALLNGSQLDALFRTTYLLIRPILIFYIVANLGMPKNYIWHVVLCLIALVILNTLAGYWQVIGLNLSGDYIMGIMRGAHNFAFFLWSAIFFLFAYATVYKSYSPFIFIGFLIVPIIVAGYLKGNILAIIVMVIGLLINIINSSRRFRYFIFAVISVLLISSTLIKHKKPEFLVVAKLLAPRLNEFGFIQGPKDLIHAFAQEPLAIIVGFGPGRFGSQYALTEGKVGRSPLADSIYRSYYYSQITSDTDNWVTRTFFNRRSVVGRSSTFLALFSEYGIIGVVVIILFFRKIIKTLVLVMKSSYSKYFSTISMGCLMVTVYILINSFTSSLREGYNAPSGIFPLMILTGLIYSSLNGKVGKFDYQSN